MSEVLDNPHVALNNARNLPKFEMPKGGPVSFHLEVTGAPDAVTAFCVAHLKDLGYAITPPGEKWETPAEFNRRLGISKEGIHRALRRAGCPHVLIHSSPGRGVNGRRITGICSNAAFDTFVLKFKKS